MFDSFDDIPTGIDLGTTNSCIGVWDGNSVKIIPNRIGERTSPSALYFLNDSEEYLVGEQSMKYLQLNCQKIYSVKRIIGRDFNDSKLAEEIKLLNYDIINDDRTKKPIISLIQNGEEKKFTPEMLSSFVLKKLVKDAEKLLMKPIKKVVITVPAYFDDAQRCATIDAAKLANLEVIRIINEPTAAALSYGFGQNFCPFKAEAPTFSKLFKENRERRNNPQNIITKVQNSFCLIKENSMNIYKNVMVFDLGGGTFDLAILKINLQKKEYEVRSKISDKYLGGDDFDNKLLEHCLHVHGLDEFKDQIDKKSLERLRISCEQAKKILSIRNEADIQVDNFINERDIHLRIARDKFENEICNDLFDRLSQPFAELLNGANLSKSDIDEIILVGGSTKMPKIKEILRKEFTCNINDSINPDEVVAYGATIQAAMLMTIGKNKSLQGIKLFDITPISLGTDVINKSNIPKIKELGNKMSVIIPKWTKIPIQLEKEYKTIKDNQDSMQISIFEGENEYLKNDNYLGKFILKDLPKLPKGKVQIKVTFKLDENNILSVTATENSSGISNKIIVESVKKQNESRKTIGKLSDSVLLEETNKIAKFNINNYLINYQKETDINKKIIILENYNKILEIQIKDINPNENAEGISGKNIERYFFYVYQLLESYEEMLHLQMDENLKKNKEDKILIIVKKYINIFKFQNIYYIEQIVDLFKDTEGNFFLKIFHECIIKLNEMGFYYIETIQKCSRYYAKLYFEEVINLYKKYKFSDNEILYDIEPMIGVKEEKQKSELKLFEINSNAISLIDKSKKERKLISHINNGIFNSIELWGEDIKESTGFTYFKNKVNIENKMLSIDEYNLILDELERIYLELKSQIEFLEEDQKKDLAQQLGICLGNIVKIKFTFLQGKKYSEYLKYLQWCLFYAEMSENNNESFKWYKDALELQKEIKEKKHNISKQIISDIEEELNIIESYFRKPNKIEFINYILEKWPYKGYNKSTRPSEYDWNTINVELINFLSIQYHPDSYPQETKEEKLYHNIVLKISQLLNQFSNEITPQNLGKNYI